MVRDAQILILDEPSSGLDSESERLVFEGLRTPQAGAHDVRDRAPPGDDPQRRLILVLDQGRIVERGTHDELVAMGGLYARIKARRPMTPARAGASAREL